MPCNGEAQFQSPKEQSMNYFTLMNPPLKLESRYQFYPGYERDTETMRTGIHSLYVQRI